MPLTTYTAGQVLTASSLNANLSFAAGAGGLVCVKAETALSGTSTVANNVFTSDYSNYLILMRYTTTGSNSISARMRVGGTSNSSANYNQQSIVAVGAATSAGLTTADTSLQTCVQSGGAFWSSAEIKLFSPAVAEPTNFHIVNDPQLGAYTSLRYYSWVGNHNVATAYDGIEFFSAGTMAGTYAIYGFAKTV